MSPRGFATALQRAFMPSHFHSSNFQAFIRAATAHFRAVAAIIWFEAFTFLGTGQARIGACVTHFLNETGAAAEKGSACPTDLGAIDAYF